MVVGQLLITPTVEICIQQCYELFIFNNLPNIIKFGSTFGKVIVKIKRVHFYDSRHVCFWSMAAFCSSDLQAAGHSVLSW